MRICSVDHTDEDEWAKSQRFVNTVVENKGAINGPCLPVRYLPRNIFTGIWRPRPCPDGYRDTLCRLELPLMDMDYEDTCEPFIVFVSDSEYASHYRNNKHITCPGIYIKGAPEDYRSEGPFFNLMFGKRFVQVKANHYYSLCRTDLERAYVGAPEEMSFIYSLAALQTFWETGKAELERVVRGACLAGYWYIPIIIFRYAIDNHGSIFRIPRSGVRNPLRIWSDMVPNDIFIEQRVGWYDELIDNIDIFLKKQYMGRRHNLPY